MMKGEIRMKEEIVAQVPDLSISAQSDFSNEFAVVEERALELTVANNIDYQSACEMLKDIKRMQKRATDVVEPIRIAVKAPYDDVLAKKKAILSPLERAESHLRKALEDYLNQQEHELQKKQRELRELAKREANNKLQEAAAAEANGDSIGAEFAMAEAEMIEDVLFLGTVGSGVPKVDGVSIGKEWRIKSVDIKAVPDVMAGVILRTVNEKAILDLIKNSKGTISIPGIEYEESIKISSVRA